jgi:hypothetical protein
MKPPPDLLLTLRREMEKMSALVGWLHIHVAQLRALLAEQRDLWRWPNDRLD